MYPQIVSSQWRALENSKKDHLLWIVEVQLLDESSHLGYLLNFSDSTIILTDRFLENGNYDTRSFHSSVIKSISYHHYGDFMHGFTNVFTPLTGIAAMAVYPDLDIWSGFIFAASMVYILPTSAVIGGIDEKRERTKRYPIEGDAFLFKQHTYDHINKACIECRKIRLSTPGKNWYHELSGESDYYPISYKPVFHIYMALGGTFAQYGDHQGFMSRFENTSINEKKTTASSFGVGISMLKRFEVGLNFNSGLYRYDVWEYSEGNYNYSFYHDYEAFYTNLYLLYHFLPFDPLRNQAIQLSVGGGLTNYSGYNYGSLEGWSDDRNISASTSIVYDSPLKYWGMNIIGRAELFVSERYSIVTQLDYNVPISGQYESLRLSDPFITLPVETRFNISSLTISTGIRLHY